MPRWEGKSKGTRLGYKIFIFVCRNLGLAPAYALLRVVAFYYLVFSVKSSRVIYRYFRERHQFGKIKSVLKIYGNYYLLGQTILDKMALLAGLRNKFTYHFDGVENLKEMIALGKGGILLSGHIGNWEMAGYHLGHLNTTINVVLFDGERQQIKEYLDGISSEKQFKIIVVENDMSHVYSIGAALANNELVCLHADRYLEGNKTTTLNFLGANALFPAGPFSLSAGFNVPVSFVFALKETKVHYHFFGSPLMLRNPDESKSEFSSRIANSYVKELENKVKAYPLQWFNYYDFWGN